MQELISLTLPKRWKEVLSSVPHAFGHTWESCYAMHLTTGCQTYLYQFKSGNINVICPIAMRNYRGHVDIVTPYGFSGFVGNADFPDFQNHWKNFVQKLGYVCGYIGLNPLLGRDTYVHEHEVYRYNTLYVLNLQLTVHELYRNLSQNRKRQLKSYEALKGSFIVDKAILKDFFLNHYYEFFSQRNASQIYSFSIKTLSYLLDLKNVLIVGILHNDRIEAVSVFAYTPYEAEYLFNVSLPEGQHHTASLLWYGVNYLESINIPYLNMGGGVREGDTIAQFKKRFGADEYPLTCLKQVYNPQVYEMLCREANKDFNKREGFFPAYRHP